MNYLRLHHDYMLSKTFITIILILMMVIQLNTLYASQILEGYGHLDAFRESFQEDYLNDVFMVMEYIFVFIGILTAISLSNKNNQALMVYTVTSKKDKWLFIIGRIILGIMFLLAVWISQICAVYAFTSGFTPYTIYLKDYFEVAIYLILEMIQYYLITLMLMVIVSTVLIGIVPLLIFWLLEISLHSLSIELQKLLTIFVININGYGIKQINLLIFIIIYIFFTINYIMVLLLKDCC